MKIILQICIIAIFSINVAFSQTASSFRNYVNEKDFEKAGELAQQVLNENPNDYNLSVAVGDVFFELEDFNKAYEAYSRAKTINSKDNKINAKLANVLVALNRAQEAITNLKKDLEKDKKNVVLLVALANAYLASGDIKNAELQITNARSIDSKNPDVFLILGKIYYEQTIWELARTNYEEALKLEPKNVQARQQLAEVYWKLAISADNAGDTDLLNEYLNRSLAECNTLVRNDDKDAASWKLKAQIHFNANQNLEAAQSYNKFLELRPNNYKERWRLSEILVKNGVCQEAFPHLKIIIDVNHKDITDSIKNQARLLLGSCYYREKQYADAAQVLEEANKSNPLNPSDLKILALSYLLANDTTNALIHFDELFKVDPQNNCDMMVRVAAMIFKAQKRYDEMVTLLSERNKICDDERNAFSYYSLGIAYYEIKNIEEAINALKKAIEYDQKYYWAYIYLGDVYYSQKNTVEGEKQFLYVIENAKLDPENSKNELNSAYLKLAGIKLDTKKYKEIIDKVGKEWLELFPENNEYAHLFLAIAYQASEDAANACKHYREVLKINPNNKTAKDNLKKIGC